MKKKRIVLILIFVITIIFVATTYSKYVYNSVWNYYLHSRGFYFKSDLLEIETKKNSILTWDGSDILFTLSNSENNSLISQYDISYKISCEILGDEKDYLDCDLNNSGKNTVTGTLSSVSKCVDDQQLLDVSNLTKSECELNNHEWKTEISNKENSFNVVLKDETKSINEVSIKITTETTSPYKKTLTGVFNLNLIENQMDYIVDYENYKEYDELVIMNKLENKKCLSINFDESIYTLDESDSIISYEESDDNKINKIKIQLEEKSASILKFYKISTETNFSVSNFIIEESEC